MPWQGSRSEIKKLINKLNVGKRNIDEIRDIQAFI